jgi:hypothetical protein
VDYNTGFVSVTPTNGLVGTYSITVATAVVEQIFDPPQDFAEAVDYQVVQIVIE